MALIGTSVYLAYEGTQQKAGDARSNTWLGAGALGLVGLVLAVQGSRGLAQDPLLGQLIQPVSIKYLMGFAFLIGGVLSGIGAITNQRTLMFSSFWGLAAGFALWFNWGHWVDLTHHWTQRDQYWVYYKLRRPDEPIAAFLMNWRGETFYSKNTVKQIRENNRMTQYAALPGRKWAQVEHNRLPILKGAAGNEHTVTVVDKDLNNKFMLVTIE